MILPKLTHEPGTVVNFFEDALNHLGALCERTWYDRLEIVAEGRSARLWNDDGKLHEIELAFPPRDTAVARDASKEVFPSCPLLFRLTEELFSPPLQLSKVVLQKETGAASKPPNDAIGEKLWLAQFPHDTRWQRIGDYLPSHLFSVIASVRCEIQAIDQHWSMHRIAFNLPKGESDPLLAQNLDLFEVTQNPESVLWPKSSPHDWGEFFRNATPDELELTLKPIRLRQRAALHRELERVETYFNAYEAELKERARRSHADVAKQKITDRLLASNAERLRRRKDQIDRHQIRSVLHIDNLLLVAESAWTIDVSFVRGRETLYRPVQFIPRARRWNMLD